MLIGLTTFFLLMLVVLGIHIYMVTRPKAPDAHTRVMVRFDIRQDIDQADADSIARWLYKQNGMDHVICSPANHNVVFTFFPVKNNPDKILQGLKSTFNIKAERYMPSAEELKSGCPVASTSPAYKAFTLLRKIF